MDLIGFPAIVIVNVLGAFRVPGVFLRELIEQCHNGFLDSLAHLGVHLLGYLLNVKQRKIEVSHGADFLHILFPEIACQLPHKLFVREQGLPILCADKAQILIYAGGTATGEPPRFPNAERHGWVVIAGCLETLQDVRFHGLILPD